jgi:hypothetical protein
LDRSLEILAAIREKASKTIWATGGCKSWFLDKKGIPIYNPVLLSELEKELDHPELRDFEMVPL